MAHDEAISNRDTSKRLDHLMKKINVTKRSISKELRELGFSTDGKKLGLDGSTKKANTTKKLKLPCLLPKKILKIQKWRSKRGNKNAKNVRNKEKVFVDRLAQIKMVVIGRNNHGTIDDSKEYVVEERGERREKY